MMTIVTEFGKFRYNRAPRGMCALGDIFQAKADDLLDDIEGVKTYIDDILFLRKDILFKHIEQLRIIFGILRASGLTANDTKCCFRLKEIPYLYYVKTQEEIKHDKKKLQGVMDIW